MDTLSFDSNIQNQSKFLHGFAFRLTKNREDAVDLYQETLYRALKNQEKFLPGSNIKGWLSTIMKNLFINMYRKRKKFHIVKEPIGSTFDYVEYFSDSERNLGEVKTTLEEINKEINCLSNEYGIPMKMLIEGYKYEEIADLLNVPIGTVKSRLFQARKQLQGRILRNFNVSSCYDLKDNY
ncbi:MAG TPA: RNA polymerase sigma factor [Saprospiraceae bacterium]|nr:RNA polymerase sigma factor [Saprospiraceae bacterium]